MPGFFLDGRTYLSLTGQLVPEGTVVETAGGWFEKRNGVGVPTSKPTNVIQIDGFVQPSSNLPISAICPIVSNEIVGGVLLVGSTGERNELLKYLNRLTDHTLGMKNIRNDLSIVFIWRHANENIKYASGNELLTRLISNQNHTTYIQHNHIGENNHSLGNNFSVIRIDPRTELQLMIIDTATGFVRKDENNVPVEITIAHELIHVDRFIRGTRICSTDRTDWSFQTTEVNRRGNQIILTDYSVPKEELATIGLEFHIDGDITENMIRAEQGIILRGAYLYR
jgi:hypothetical protein